MLEESLEPRPRHEAFARFMALRAAERADCGVLEQWLNRRNRPESDWTRERNIEHWIDRSRR